MKKNILVVKYLITYVLLLSHYSGYSQNGKKIFDLCKTPESFVITDSIYENGIAYNKFFKCKYDSTIRLVEYYNSSGQLFSDVISKKKSPYSMVRFYELGTIISSTEMRNGKREGEYITYFSSGKMAIKGNYKNDKESGIWYYYNEIGKIVKTKKY